MFVSLFYCVCRSVFMELVGEKSRHSLQEHMHLITSPVQIIWGKEDDVRIMAAHYIKLLYFYIHIKLFIHVLTGCSGNCLCREYRKKRDWLGSRFIFIFHLLKLKAANCDVSALRCWTCRGRRCCRRHCQTARWSCWTTAVTLLRWSDPGKLLNSSWTSSLHRESREKTLRRVCEEKHLRWMTKRKLGYDLE